MQSPVLAIVNPSVCPSVCPSVTRWHDWRIKRDPYSTFYTRCMLWIWYRFVFRIIGVIISSRSTYPNEPYCNLPLSLNDPLMLHSFILDTKHTFFANHSLHGLLFSDLLCSTTFFAYVYIYFSSIFCLVSFGKLSWLHVSILRVYYTFLAPSSRYATYISCD